VRIAATPDRQIFHLQFAGTPPVWPLIQNGYPKSHLATSTVNQTVLPACSDTIFYYFLIGMSMIYKDRMTAKMDGDFVVFLIGMRLNKPWLLHKLLPVFGAMPKMLKELYSQPELGLIHHEMWFSRTIILVQYWRSIEQLMDYAKNKDAAHLPAWQAFNKAIGTDGTVGIWHETYKAGPGSYENVYANMPAFGLGKAGTLVQAKGHLKSASDRLNS
jgi:hypothetical protein